MRATRKSNVGRFEILEASESGIGGLKEAVALIEGDKVYSKLKHESGVHRVQRVPQTRSEWTHSHLSDHGRCLAGSGRGRRQDRSRRILRIDTFCSSGPGGQSG